MVPNRTWQAALLALVLLPISAAQAGQNGVPIGQQLAIAQPTANGRYYGAAKGGYSSLADMQIVVQKTPGSYQNTDLAVVVRRMNGSFVNGYKFFKASTELKFSLPAHPSRCSVETRGDKLCLDNVTVCGGHITQANHFEIAIYTLSAVPDPAVNPPPLSAVAARKNDPGLRVYKGVGVRGFDPGTKEYPATKNVPYMPPPGGINDANTCRPGPEPWPEPEPSYNANAL